MRKRQNSKCNVRKYFAVPGALVSPAVAVYGWCKLTSDLDPHTCKGNSNWSSSMQISQNLHFQVILQVDLRWLLTLICDLWPHEHIKVPYYINKSSLVQIWLQLFKWDHFHIFSLSYNLTSDDLWPWYMTFDHMDIWRFPYCINKPSLVPIGLQLFKRGHFHIFNLSLQLDLRWPLTLICDLWHHQQMGFPCCIYEPTLVEIHQSMWKLEPNVNLFSQQQQQTTYKRQRQDNNSGQTDPYVSFLLRQATQKILRNPRTTSGACRHGLWMMQVNTWPWSSHLLG